MCLCSMYVVKFPFENQVALSQEVSSPVTIVSVFNLNQSDNGDA